MIRKIHQQVDEDYFIYLIGRIWANSSLPASQRCMVLVEGFRRRFTEVMAPRAIKAWPRRRQDTQGLARRPRLSPWLHAGQPTCRINKGFTINAAQHVNGSWAAL